MAMTDDFSACDFTSSFGNIVSVDGRSADSTASVLHIYIYIYIYIYRRTARSGRCALERNVSSCCHYQRIRLPVEQCNMVIVAWEIEDRRNSGNTDRAAARCAGNVNYKMCECSACLHILFVFAILNVFMDIASICGQM